MRSRERMFLHSERRGGLLIPYSQVRAFCARWGPESAPNNPVAGTENFIRYVRKQV